MFSHNMSSCTYFQSDEWYDLAWDAVAEWDIKDATNALDKLSISEIDEKQSLTVGDLNWDALSIDRRRVVDMWCDVNDIPDYCPRDTTNNGWCSLHCSGKTDNGVIESAIESTDPDDRVFTAVQIPELNLDSAVPDGPNNRPIHFCFARFDSVVLSRASVESTLDFRCCEITSKFSAAEADLSGRLLLSRATIGGAINLRHMSLNGGATLRHVEVGGKTDADYLTASRGVECENAEFGGRFSAHDCLFQNGATFEDAEFSRVAHFKYCTFGGGAKFSDITVQSNAIFTGATFCRGGTFEGAIFESSLYFRYSTVQQGIRINDVEIKNECDFKGTRFERGGTFEGSTLGTETTFDDVVFAQTVNFRNATFETASFKRTSFQRISRFNHTEFGNKAKFQNATFRDARFIRTEARTIIDCSEATLFNGKFSDPVDDTVYYDFTEAKLGDITLAFETDPFLHCKISQAKFDGFQFTIMEHVTVLRGSWTLHETAGTPFKPDSNPTIENTYQKAKNGALKLGENEAASEFFRREMKFRRKAHFDGIITANNRHRGRSLVRWIMNWGFNISCGYGERPLWTVLNSAVAIILFAFLFWVAGINMDRPQDYLLVSAQSFVAFIIGDVPTDEINKLEPIASIGAFVGAFAIGLFIFALTRSVSRD